jgi:hypothetical protein
MLLMVSLCPDVFEIMLWFDVSWSSSEIVVVINKRAPEEEIKWEEGKVETGLAILLSIGT